jgi:putative ATPase
LLSRASVYVLKSLDEAEMGQLFDRACAQALADLVCRRPAKRWSAGRWRCPAPAQPARTGADGGATAGLSAVDGAFIEETVAQNLRRFDKGGDAFYDQISALHKSVRGSSPDGALYWFCRMLDGGADPRYLARRIIRMAWEDIGLADPRAMQIANDAARPTSGSARRKANWRWRRR